MATRKVKHQRALEKREAFLKTVHEGNQDWLKQAQTARIEKKREEEAAALERKKAKSRELALANGKITPKTVAKKKAPSFKKVRRQETKRPQRDQAS